MKLALYRLRIAEHQASRVGDTKQADEHLKAADALEAALSSASETAPPTDVDELIAELKSALEELRIAGATPKCQRCDYPNCYCKPSPNDIVGSS
jgi:hypothetical protein